MAEETETIPKYFKEATAKAPITIYGVKINTIIGEIPIDATFFLKEIAPLTAFTSPGIHGVTGTHKFYEVYFEGLHGYILDDDVKDSTTK